MGQVRHSTTRGSAESQGTAVERDTNDQRLYTTASLNTEAFPWFQMHAAVLGTRQEFSTIGKISRSLAMDFRGCSV